MQNEHGLPTTAMPAGSAPEFEFSSPRLAMESVQDHCHAGLRQRILTRIRCNTPASVGKYYSSFCDQLAHALTLLSYVSIKVSH